MAIASLIALLAFRSVSRGHDTWDLSAGDESAEAAADLSANQTASASEPVVPQANNPLLEQVFENSYTLIAYMDTQFNFIRVNKAYQAAHNKSEAELIGHNYFALYPDEENERIFREVVASGVSHHTIAKPFVSASKSAQNGAYWNWSLQPVYENHDMVGLLLILVDVTEQLTMQSQLMMNDKALRKAQKIGHFGGWHWDIATNELRWTEEVYRIFGRDPGKFMPTYTDFLDMVYHEDRANVINSVNRCLSDNIAYDIEHRITRSDGEIRYVHQKAEMQYAGDGRQLYWDGMVHDITDRKAAEQELENYRQNLEQLVAERTGELEKSLILLRKENEARKQVESSLILSKEEAEKANQLKTEFLSRVSHELRTPMNAILGFGQLLGMEELDKHQSDYIDEILGAGSHLLELISEVLDLSKIETGGLRLDLQYIALHDLIADCLPLVKNMAEARDIELSIELSEAIDDDLYVDRMRFKQVLINLLTNAIKYNSSPGKVSIRSCLHAPDRLRVSITDTGPGISVEKQEAIFEPFNRLGAEYSAIEGSGIGLTIARQLVHMMQCEMGVESEPGTGSTFWVECPLAVRHRTHGVAAPQQVARPQSWAASSKRTIVYIEDNAANLRLVQHLISRLEDVELYTAADAESGIKLACEKRPDLILLDINLPGMDGYEAFSRLRKRGETRTIPVIAVSAAAMPSDIERAMTAGFKRYITKPINVRELVDVIAAELDGGPPPIPAIP